MKPNPTDATGDSQKEIAALVKRLHETQQRLQELTGGQVDAVVHSGGQTYLLKEAEGKLREGEKAQRKLAETLLAILNALPAHVALLDAKGQLISMNEAWKKFARDNAPGHFLFSDHENYLELCELATGDGAETARKAAAGIRQVLSGSVPQFCLEYCCHPPIEHLWFSLIVTPVGGRRPSGAVVMHLDITARRMADEAVRHSEERFRGMFATATIGIALAAPAGNYLEANAAFCRMLDYTEDELRALDFPSITHSDDLDRNREQWDELLRRERQSVTMEKRYVKKTGDTIWARVSISAIHDAGGEVATLIIMAEDITERKLAEATLRSTASNLAVSQRIAHLGSWELDLLQMENLWANPLRWSDEMYRVMGYEPHSVAVTPDFFLSHFSPEVSRAIDERLLKLLRGEPHSYFYSIMRPSGERRIVHSEAQVIFEDETGRPLKFVGTVHDVTDAKALEEQLLSKTALLEAQLHSTLDGILIVDNQGRKILQNRQTIDLWKIPKEMEDEVPQQRRLAWITAQTKNPKAFAAKVAHLYDHPDEISRDEIELLDGRFIDRYSAPVVGQDGTHHGRIWVYRDITDRKVAEGRASQQLELMSIASRVGKLGAWTLEYPGPKIIWSDEIYRIHELPPSFEPSLESALDFITPASRKKVEAAIATRRPYDLELELITAKGNKRWVRTTSQVDLKNEEKERLYGVLQDITESKRNETRVRRLVDSNAQGVFFWHQNGQILEANDSFLGMVGYAREDLEAGRINWINLTPPDHGEADRRALAEISLRGACSPYEKEYIRKDGSRVTILLGAAVFEDHPEEGVCFAIDLTEQKKSEARFRRLVDSNIQGVMFWNAEGEVASANDAFLQIVGYSREDLDAGRVNWRAITPPDHADRDLRALNEITARGVCTAYEKDLIRKDGSRVPVLIGAAGFDNSAAEGVVFVLDLTQQKKLEHQFLRAQRMESIGTLAGGIAHDLNNILAPIMMAVHILKLSATDPQSQTIIETIEISAKRGADIVSQVLSFARGVEGERVEIQPRHLLKDIEAIIKDTFPKNIRWNFAASGDSWTVLGDPTQVHQILLNLCVNARDAMPDGGSLTLDVENVVLDEQYASMHIEARAGRYVAISVTDTGIGIPATIIENIFDPFFTTKEVGKGTGLGLSTVMAIVKSHGGFVNVYSEPGHGSCFKAYLPASDTVSRARRKTGSLDVIPRGKGELILIVDDEASILTITSQTLESLGYRSLTAGDGAEAIALYAQHKNDIAVVLTDMAMPIMDGQATIRALMKINPEVKIIAATGLKTEGSEARAAERGVRHFLAKPYTAATLLKTLRKVLGTGDKSRKA